MLVVAGPGAGKTYCLIQRAEYLVGTLGMEPSRLCVLTFTNKAAQEIASRLVQTFGVRSVDVTGGTLHALCARILREFGTRMGIPKGFGIADDAYQRTTLRRLKVPIRQHREALQLFTLKRLQHHTLTDPDEQLFQLYTAELRRQNLLDFDDLIAETRKLFLTHLDVASQIRSRWDYVLVDEFQDLSVAQYEIVVSIGKHGQIFAVGDDDQSIFSWAGADPRVLTRFANDFYITDAVVLETNHRCTRQIFEAARRLIDTNPSLFDKRLIAQRTGTHEVEVRHFLHDAEESIWLLADIQSQRETHQLDWGDFAILYRKHQSGIELEKALIQADIPCRLAKGRAVLDDDVIAYVVASLRVIQRPHDSAVIDTFAERLLPADLVDRARAMAPEHDDLVSAMRSYALCHTRGAPDTRMAWRFVYHVENLRALKQSHDNLHSLVEDLLSQRVGMYRNPLEVRAEDLTDPPLYPGARELAEVLRSASASGAVAVEGRSPLAYVARRLLEAAGYTTRQAAADDGQPAHITGDSLATRNFPVLLFKAMQLLHSEELTDAFRNYVTFDLETTDGDLRECEIVEIGAARVRNGKIVDKFQSLVRCTRPISIRATEVHGYTNDHVADAPAWTDVWVEFKRFFGGDVLVAHNGHEFDVPVLRRAVGAEHVEEITFFDTVPLAKSLFKTGVGLEALANRFDIDPGCAHHALDDAVTLAQVLNHLSTQRLVRSRKAMLANALDWLGLALVLQAEMVTDGEEKVLLEVARPYTLGRYSDCLEAYEIEREERLGDSAPTLEEVIERLGGRRLMDRIRTTKTARERYPTAMGRLQTLIDTSMAPTIDESTELFLERVALSTSDGPDTDPHRVNLLTLHSTKGLEFSRVYIIGVEDYQLPGYYQTIENRADEIEEARRLLYVGMTRARDRLVLTYAGERFGRPSGGHAFLNEIGIKPIQPVPDR
jgi:DNA polymerase III epsilon subunit family exonuclease